MTRGCLVALLACFLQGPFRWCVNATDGGGIECVDIPKGWEVCDWEIERATPPRKTAPKEATATTTRVLGSTSTTSTTVKR